jgi:hypothetical protein
MMRVRTVSAMTAMAIVTTLGVPAWFTGSVAEAALDRPYPIYLVEPSFDLTTILSVDDISSDGRFAVVDTTFGPAHVTVPAGATQGVRVDGFVADDGGVFAYRVGGLRSIVQLRLATGETTEFGVTFPTAGVKVAAVIDADASGRRVLIDGWLDSSTRLSHYVLDTTTGVATAPIYGEGFAAVDGTPSWRSISSDGRFAIADWSPISGASIRHETMRVDLDTGELVVRRAPDEEGFPGGTSYVSSDLSWMVFESSVADVVPGLPAGVRLYRRNLMTGATDVVPVDVSTVRRYDVHDGGRVVVSHVVPTPADAEARQLSVWEGAGPLVTLTVGVDGELADLGVDESDVEFEANADASRITFTSRATNLAPGATSTERRLFQVVLPSLSPAGPAAVVLPDESVCAAVPGAVPGEFVGVNVTPVGASTAGFGVVHSSDARAGSTSNVNFGPGTVDPNVAFVEVGVDGEVCFTNSRHGPVEVVIDAMVVAEAGSLAEPFAGADRVLDTRAGDPVAASGSVCATAASGEAFVGLNVTPVEAIAPGFGTVHASDASPGRSSTVNFGPGTVDPNFAFVQSGADGAVCFTNSEHGPVDVIIDRLVTDEAGTLRAPVVGADGGRPVDTRVGVGGTRLSPSASVCFAVDGAQPGEFVGVNVTPVGAAALGFGTVHPPGSEPGGVSNVNFGPGTVDPNFAMTQVGADGTACFTNSVHGEVDVIIDAQVIGAADAFRLPSADGGLRILDTRELRP